MKNTLFIILLPIILITKPNYSKAECTSDKCERQGFFYNIGKINNPGPHKVCVGSTPIKPNITYTNVYPGIKTRTCSIVEGIYTTKYPQRMQHYNNTDQTTSINYITEPPLPEKFTKPGIYKFNVKVKAYFERCEPIESEYIGNIKFHVEKNNCCDVCKKGEKELANFSFSNIGISNWNSWYNPTHEKEISEYMELFQFKKIIRNLIKKIVAKTKEELLKKEGARIWIKLNYKECEESRCWTSINKKALGWQKKEKWYRCSIGNGEYGLGFGMSEIDGVEEIIKAIKPCLSEAQNALFKQ